MVAFSSAVCASDQLMVIIHSDNQMQSVTKQELRKIFTGDKMYFENRKIASFLSSNSKESSLVLERVYQLRNKRLLKKMWLKKLYRGVVFTQPSIVASSKDVIQNVSTNPSAIGIISVQTVPKTVRILKIDNQRYL